MAYLTLIQTNPRKFRLLPPSVTIGSSIVNDIVLEAGTVSRRHALIEFLGSGWQIRDLDSTNGVYVNGAAVSMTELNFGDTLTIGDELLLFHERAEDPIPSDRNQINSSGSEAAPRAANFISRTKETPGQPGWKIHPPRAAPQVSSGTCSAVLE